MERIANFEDSAAATELALKLASFGSNFMGSDFSDLNGPLHSDPLNLCSGSSLASQLDEKARKSQNMTECVPVPTSEHVAEIVGRQGECLSCPAFHLIDSAGGAAGGGRAVRGIQRGKVVSHPEPAAAGRE
jgi:hypothetical protein